MIQRKLLFNFTISFLIISTSLVACKKHIEQTEYNILTESDSLLLSVVLDSLTNNYKSDNQYLLDFSEYITSIFPKNTAEINTKLAYIHYSKENYYLTEYYFDKAAKQYLYNNLLEKYAEQITNLGVVKEISGSYTEAAAKYFEALKIFDSLNLELKSSRVYNNLGIIYQQLKEYNKALKYYTKSLKITNNLNKPNISAKRYNNIATIYEETNLDLDSALYYYNKAYKIWIKDSTNIFLPIIENNIGYIHLLKDELIAADSLFNKALKFCIKNKQKKDISPILRNQAKLLIIQENYDLAIIKVREAINLAKSSSNKEVELESLEVLIEVLEKTKNYKLANNIIKEHYKLLENVGGIEQKKQINQLNIQYNTKKKEHEIQLLELKNNSQKTQLLQRSIIISTLTILLIGMFFVVRLQKKNNQLKYMQMNIDIANYINQLDEIKNLNNQSKNICEQNLKNELKQFQLSVREEEVLILIAKGYKNSEISKKLFLSINTIKTHTKNIFIKLDVRNRTEAASKIRL